jgi:Fe-S-cluster containining protein
VLTEEDTLRIAAFLGLSPEAFVNRHTDLRRNRQGLTLRSREDGSCEFLDGKDCTLQPVKPEQCLGFPNQWRFPGWREMCEAIEVPP